MSSFPSVLQHFRAAKTNAGSLLYNTRTGERYSLSQAMLDLLLRCNGRTSHQDLLTSMEADPSEIDETLDVLETMGVVQQELSPLANPHTLLVTAFNEPVWMQWNITNQCNLRCKHCYLSSGGAKEGELSTHESLDAVEQMANLHVHYVVLSGGEPLLREDLFDIIGHLVELNVGWNLLTNGTLLTDSVVRRLAELSPQVVQVSLDGNTDRMQRELRPGVTGAQFDTTLQGVRLLMENGINTEVSTVVTNLNIKHLKEMARTVDSLGVDSWKVGSLFSAGRARTETTLHPPLVETLQALLDLDILYARGEIRTPLKTNILWDSFLIGDPEKREYICGGDIGFHGYLMPDGEVLPCDRIPGDWGFPSKNIRQVGLKDCWFSDQFQRFNLTRTSDIEECSTCTLRDLCGAGCRVLCADSFESSFVKDLTACRTMQFYSENAQVLPEGRLRQYWEEHTRS